MKHQEKKKYQINIYGIRNIRVSQFFYNKTEREIEKIIKLLNIIKHPRNIDFFYSTKIRKKGRRERKGIELQNVWIFRQWKFNG